MLSFEVTAADTAIALGSGDVAVLATPRLLAWCEAATVQALDTGPGRTSVGTRVTLEHLLATPVGMAVHVEAEQVHADGRLVRFAVAVHDEPADGERRLVATAEVTRVVVDRERFLSRLPRP